MSQGDNVSFFMVEFFWFENIDTYSAELTSGRVRGREKERERERNNKLQTTFKRARERERERERKRQRQRQKKRKREREREGERSTNVTVRNCQHTRAGSLHWIGVTGRYTMTS